MHCIAVSSERKYLLAGNCVLLRRDLPTGSYSLSLSPAFSMPAPRNSVCSNSWISVSALPAVLFCSCDAPPEASVDAYRRHCEVQTLPTGLSDNFNRLRKEAVTSCNAIALSRWSRNGYAHFLEIRHNCQRFARPPEEPQSLTD